MRVRVRRAVRRFWIPVAPQALGIDGDGLTAFAKIADGDVHDGDPSPRYLTLLREGARDHGLPAHWIDHLDTVRPAN